MEKISLVIEGELLAIPVLDTSHLTAIKNIQTRVSPCCAPDILRDLVEAGLVEDTTNEGII
ncbi:hypothetical protein [uncultured Brevibacillus sp.]|uniref:hypothetical protein n=1 Tax=uncultured Brevibacillus sp. TaxID=169970 RepID=UPI002593048A|nr:hypothetical protein [uncultured Brevibacillus sp.]